VAILTGLGATSSRVMPSADSGERDQSFRPKVITDSGRS
jgi:hypothetical protein